MYAVIRSGGKQHRVTAGEQLRLEKLPGEVGEQINFEDVLLVQSDTDLKVGTPTVAGASVTGRIVEHGKGKKVIVSTYKRRKGVARTLGHRQLYTLVEITGITG